MRRRIDADAQEVLAPRPLDPFPLVGVGDDGVRPAAYILGDPRLEPPPPCGHAPEVPALEEQVAYRPPDTLRLLQISKTPLSALRGCRTRTAGSDRRGSRAAVSAVALSKYPSNGVPSQYSEGRSCRSPAEMLITDRDRGGTVDWWTWRSTEPRGPHHKLKGPGGPYWYRVAAGRRWASDGGRSASGCKRRVVRSSRGRCRFSLPGTASGVF